MTGVPWLTARQWLIVIHDLLATAAALIVTFLIRFEDQALAERLDWLPLVTVGLMAFAAPVYFFAGLHEAKWRFTSLPELARIIGASLVLAMSLLVLDYILLSPAIYGTFFFGKVTIALYFVIQTAFLSGTRIAYRYFRDVRTQRHSRGGVPTLLLGRAADVEVPLRSIESGAISKISPVGLLSPARSDRGVSVRGVPVLGGFDDLEQVIALLRERNVAVTRLVLTPSAFEPGSGAESILLKARQLGIPTSRLPALDETGKTLELTPVAVEDLLLRPSVKIDYQRLENFLRGKSVVVTGGGGSIGSEICDRIVTFGASRLLVVEHSEPSLYAVTAMLAAKGSPARNRWPAGRHSRPRSHHPPARRVQARHRVSCRRAQAGADARTGLGRGDQDQRVRLGECRGRRGRSRRIRDGHDFDRQGDRAGVRAGRDQAVWRDVLPGARRGVRTASGGRAAKTRFISVRFGNVLASNGSVVPKFKAQIEAGGPVTVTHPDMVRYFMTIREACDLVVSASSHALGPERSDVSVYVLNMGQPVKILDLAERMIRLSGLEPGRDVQIEFIGIRPGERLNEILFARGEKANDDIGISGIVAARPVAPSLDVMRGWLATLEAAVVREERAAIDAVLHEAVPDFRGAAA